MRTECNPPEGIVIFRTPVDMGRFGKKVRDTLSPSGGLMEEKGKNLKMNVSSSRDGGETKK